MLDTSSSSVIQNILKSQDKCKLHLARIKQLQCTVQSQYRHDLYNILTIRMLGVPSHWKGICGLNPAKAHCYLQKSSVNCLAFIISVVLSHVYTPPHAGVAKPGRQSLSFN